MKFLPIRSIPIAASLGILPLLANPVPPEKPYLDAILERSTPPTQNEIETLDLNNDGQIDVRDLVIFLESLQNSGAIKFSLTTSLAVAEELIASQPDAIGQQDGQVSTKLRVILGPGLVSPDPSQPTPSSTGGIRLVEATLAPSMASPASQLINP